MRYTDNKREAYQYETLEEANSAAHRYSWRNPEEQTEAEMLGPAVHVVRLKAIPHHALYLAQDPV